MSHGVHINNNHGRSKPLAASLLLVIFTAMVLLFQNCDPQVVENGSGFGSDMPFAFTTKVDHLSYMSCAGMSQNKISGYHTFRLRAHEAGSGVQMKSEFFQDAKFFSDDEIPDLLANSPVNAGAELQLAVRNVFDMQELKASNLTDGEDIDNLLAPLTEPPVIDTLLDGEAHNRFSGFADAGGDRELDGQISFIKSHNDVKDLRTAMDDSTNSAQYLLALTYRDSKNGEAAAKQPNGGSGSGAGLAYGVGFKVRFAASAGSNRKLFFVRQVNLEDGRVDAVNWTCKSYLIVRPTDSDISTKFTQNEGANDSAARAMLSSGFAIGEYEISTGNSVEAIKAPAGGYSCYGGLANDKPMNFAGTCVESSDCPHYFSVCTKD